MLSATLSLLLPRTLLRYGNYLHLNVMHNNFGAAVNVDLLLLLFQLHSPNDDAGGFFYATTLLLLQKFNISLLLLLLSGCNNRNDDRPAMQTLCLAVAHKETNTS